MTASQKHPAKSKILTLAIAGLLVAIGVGVFVVRQNDRQVLADAAKTKSADQYKPVKSVFMFTGSEGWWQGATNGTSMAVFNEEKGCFVSGEYKKGRVDATAELKKIRDILVNYTVSPDTVQTLAVQTASGPKAYVLHQSSVTTPGGALKVKGGQEFGYLQLSDGYLKIMGYCDVPEDLAVTIPALSAIKYTGKL